jgi:hypothetical protein
MWEYFARHRLAGAISTDALSLLDSFASVAARAQGGGVGHLFARVFAVEMTIVDSPLFKAIASKFCADGDAWFQDCRSWQTPVEHWSVLTQRTLDGRVLVENDASRTDGGTSTTGERWVDVAFPAIVRRDADGGVGSRAVRVLCECKAVQDANECWKAARKFFERFLSECQQQGELLDADKGLFVSLFPFTHYVPQQRATVGGGASAHDARRAVLDMLRDNSMLSVIEVTRGLTRMHDAPRAVLPLESIANLAKALTEQMAEETVRGISVAAAAAGSSGDVYPGGTPTRR